MAKTVRLGEDRGWTVEQLRSVWTRRMGRAEPESLLEARAEGQERQWFLDQLTRDHDFATALGQAYPAPDDRRTDLSGSYLDTPFAQYKERMDRILLKYFQWETPALVNACQHGQDKGKGKGKGKGQDDRTPRVVEMNVTQRFVQQWMFPQMPTKGLLLNINTGGGKTCAAVAAASDAFTEQGWTILWVTRTTLTRNVWKNIFEDVCDETIKRYLAGGGRIPAEFKDARRLVPSNWVTPVSFKTLSNAASGMRNELWQDLTRRLTKQGLPTTDLLRRCLLIIDESHLLYNPEGLSVQERPTTAAIERLIWRSYRLSGDESVRCLLMTATVIVNGVMDLLRQLNLLIPVESMRFPTSSYDAFAQEYLSESRRELTPTGVEKFLERAKGIISYLDRSKDPRQFAQVRFHEVKVPLSGALAGNGRDDCLAQAKTAMEACQASPGSGSKKEQRECAARVRASAKACLRSLPDLTDTQFFRLERNCSSTSSP